MAGAESREDLFLFTVEHVTLKKGQRMVLPIKEFELEYRDVYTLDLPFSPPPEVWRRFNSEQLDEVARLAGMSKVMHKIRLKNTSDCPLTTAPALILANDRLLAQGMMKYTSIGSEGDVTVTQAVDVKTEKKDKEINRDPKAVEWNGDWYGRIDLTGRIKITNYHDKAVDLEVTRHVLGQADECDQQGQIEMTNVFEDLSFLAGTNRPHWWRWHSWPHWWYRFNGVGRIRWKVRLEPGKNTELNYAWHYYWR